MGGKCEEVEEQLQLLTGNERIMGVFYLLPRERERERD